MLPDHRSFACVLATLCAVFARWLAVTRRRTCTYRRIGVSPDRPLARRPGDGRARCAGQQPAVLHGFDRRRRVEDDQRRTDLGERLRRPDTGRHDWRHRYRPFGPERHLRGHRRGTHSRGHHGAGRRPLEIHRRRQDLRICGLRGSGPDRQDRGASDEPGPRLRRGAGPDLDTERGTRRLSHDRRRQNLGAGAEGQPGHRRHRRDDGPDQPAHSVRRHVAPRPQALVHQVRRRRRRHLQDHRRRRQLGATGRRPARADRQDWRRGTGSRPLPGLRADRGRPG